MALNPTKSVAILLGTSQRLKSLFGLKSVNVAAAVIPLSDKVKILGATLDANLTMAAHVKALSSSCSYHIRSFRQIRPSLNDSMAASVASALISSRLDQLNSILYGIMALCLSTPLVLNVSSPACSGSGCLVPAFSYISTVFKCTSQTAPLASYWMAYTVQTCHHDLQSFAHWWPAISFWPLATPWT